MRSAFPIDAILKTGVKCMKFRIATVLVLLVGGLVFAVSSSLKTTTPPDDPRTIPEVIVLGEKVVLGKVTFKHQDHISRKVEGVAEVTCATCHHSERSVADAGGKTVHPADRTVTLTAETFKDAKTPSVTKCVDCHLPKGATPSILKEVPQITAGDKKTVLNNQNAFHAACTGCHEAALKTNAALKAPKANQCMQCHKKS